MNTRRSSSARGSSSTDRSSASDNPFVDVRRVRRIPSTKRKPSKPPPTSTEGDEASSVVTSASGDAPTITYWMCRDQRAEDNYAMLYACQLAAERGPKGRVEVVFAAECANALCPGRRQHDFLITGLRETARALRAKGYTFRVLRGGTGNPAEAVASYVEEVKPMALVCDFNPLREPLRWVQEIASNIACPVLQVDAHNIVPTWVASNKQEYAARTFRPKITSLLPQFLVPFPPLPVQRSSTDVSSAFSPRVKKEKNQKSKCEKSEKPLTGNNALDMCNLSLFKGLRGCAASGIISNAIVGRTTSILQDLRDLQDLQEIAGEGIIDASVAPVANTAPVTRAGTTAGMTQLSKFVSARLGKYDRLRNDPNEASCSDLSPYLHFGQISAQRVALYAREHGRSKGGLKVCHVYYYIPS